MTNLATNQAFSIVDNDSNAVRKSAEWIAEAPLLSNGRVMPLAMFDSVEFLDAHVTINGVRNSLTEGRWEVQPVTMRSMGSVKAAPQNITNGSFGIDWFHY
jgi:hypothetical protein